MSRPALRDNSSDTGWSPFLAVLLCTLGAVVVLLMAVTAASREVSSRRTSTPTASAPDPQLLEQQRQFAARITAANAASKQIKAQLDQATKLLNDEQQKMLTVEDHLRRLQEQYAALRRMADELESLEENHLDDQAQGESELARLKALIDEYRQKVADARETADRPQSFSLIPYDGPNGTNRRPVYIECTAESVIIQPEGIELKPVDFHPELGAGNPLASAVRAAQLYYERETSDPDDQPYPLIIVRPDGIGSFLEARRALLSWDADYGYELISEEMKIDFGVGNPELAVRMQEAIAAARARQAVIAEQAPVLYQRREITSFDLSHRVAGRGGDSSTGGLFAGMSNVEGGVATMGEGSPGTRGTGNGGRVSSFSGVDEPRLGDAPLDSMAQSAGSGESAQPAESPTATASEAAGGGTAGGDVDAGTATPLSGGNMASAASPAASANSASTANQAGSTASNASSSAANGAGSPGAEGSGSGGSPSAAASVASNQSTASTPGAAIDSEDDRVNFAVARPVKVLVTAERLVVVPESIKDIRYLSPAMIRQGVAVSQDRRTMLSSFGEQMRSEVAAWGIAGDGVRWKPFIELIVVPGGEEVAAIITQAAQQSGTEVRLPQAAQAQEPPNGSSTR